MRTFTLMLPWVQLAMALSMWWSGPELEAGWRGFALWVLAGASFMLSEKVRQIDEKADE